MNITTGQQLADACKKLVKDYKTLYVLGCFGAPLTVSSKQRYINAQSYNRKSIRSAKINSALPGTFGFDCVGMIKALLWDWNGNLNSMYGGASYAKNGVPDCDANVMLNKCKGISKDFSQIPVGAAVGIHNHIGVYIGDGLAVECTPAWNDGCQITAVGNIGAKSGYHTRTWDRWGMLPWLTYNSVNDAASKDGWSQDNYGWHYCENGTAVKNRWEKDSSGWCYLDGTGYAVSDRWVQDNAFWYYFDKDCHMVTDKWIKDSKDWCYIDAEGKMLTNAWVEDSSGWCFVTNDGHILKDGYANDSAGRHYIDNTGHMVN